MPEGDTSTDPVDLGAGDVVEPVVETPAFDIEAEIPSEALPEGIRESLRGKSVKDMGDLYAKSREYVSRLGAKNKELEAALAKKGEQKPAELTDEEIDTLLKDRQEKEIVQGPDYQEVLTNYLETDEIPEDFLDAVEKNGVRVSRRDVEKFMAYVKADRHQKIEHITAAADGVVEGQDLWDWMGSEECTMSEGILNGFNEQAEEGDYAWVGLVVKKYTEWMEGGGKPAARGKQSRFSRGPTRRGRPPQPRPGEGQLGADEFKTEWMKLTQQQASGQISKADEIKAKRTLEQRRRQTAGDS